jgi:hypothetical protein
MCKRKRCPKNNWCRSYSIKIKTLGMKIKAIMRTTLHLFFLFFTRRGRRRRGAKMRESR